MKKIMNVMLILFLVFYSTNCTQKDDKQEEKNIDIENVKNDNQGNRYEIKSPDNTFDTDQTQTIDNQKELPKSSMKEPILPDWAKEIGLSLPEGLKFVSNLSNISEYNPNLKTVNSINLVFSGNIDKSLKEAEKIAKKAKIPPSEDFIRAREEQKKHQKMLLSQGEKVEFPELKGMIYSNSKPDSKVLESLKYLITIIVEENGNLVINAVDNKQSRNFYK